VRITLRPSGYVICGLLAGALASGFRGDPLTLLAVWVLVDLALGASYHGFVHGARLLPWGHGDKRLAPAELIAALLGAVLTVAIGAQLGEPVSYLARVALALGVVVALVAGHDPEGEAAPLLAGLQVALAWGLGALQGAGWQGPVMWLGLAAGVGTWCRLRYRTRSGSATLWATRLAWAAWVAVLLLARQPLLAGLVGLTGVADDLHRLAPNRYALSDALTTAGWIGAWFLVALASTYWGAWL
jgi:hypothetical protein